MLYNVKKICGVYLYISIYKTFKYKINICKYVECVSFVQCALYKIKYILKSLSN